MVCRVIEAEARMGEILELGAALTEIRDSGLYKMYGTFEKYCKEKWGYERRTAYRLIDSAKVISNVSHGTQEEFLPSSERQTRPLSSLPPEEQQEAWHEAVETAPNGKITAAHVQEVVDEMESSKEEQKIGVIEEEAPQIIDRTMKQGKGVMKRDPLSFLFLIIRIETALRWGGVKREPRHEVVPPATPGHPFRTLYSNFFVNIFSKV